MEFSRPEYWSGESFPSPGDLSNPGTELWSPTLQADSLPAEPHGKPKNTGVGSLPLLQQIFPTQESNQGPAVQVDSLSTELSGKPRYSQSRCFSGNLDPWSTVYGMFPLGCPMGILNLANLRQDSKPLILKICCLLYLHLVL